MIAVWILLGVVAYFGAWSLFLPGGEYREATH